MDKFKVINDESFKFVGTVLKKYVGTSLCVKIPYGVTRIDAGAFKLCDNIKRVEIPSTVKTIGASAFEFCTSLEEIVIPESVSYVENNAFAGCCSLTKAEIYGDVKYISQGCFKGCGLITVMLPACVTRIKESAFSGCKYLEKVTIEGKENKITHIENSAFEGCHKLVSLCTEKENGIVFSECLEYIGVNAFSECKKIHNISLGGVRKIDNCAFAKCHNLTDIVFPERLTYVGACAFSLCKKISELTFLGDDLEISYRAFEGCVELKKISFHCRVKHIGVRAFYKCKGIKEIIPCEYLKRLSTQQWKTIFTEDSVEEFVFNDAYTGSALFNDLYNEPAKSFEKIVKERRHDKLKIFLDNATKITDFAFDQMIEIAENYKDSEAVGMVVSAKNIIYPKERLDEIEREEFEKDFGFKERTCDDWAGIFSFTKTANGIEISGYKSQRQKEVIIPSEIDGTPVVTIRKRLSEVLI